MKKSIKWSRSFFTFSIILHKKLPKTDKKIGKKISPQIPKGFRAKKCCQHLNHHTGLLTRVTRFYFSGRLPHMSAMHGRFIQVLLISPVCDRLSRTLRWTEGMVTKQLKNKACNTVGRLGDIMVEVLRLIDMIQVCCLTEKRRSAGLEESTCLLLRACVKHCLLWSCAAPLTQSDARSLSSSRRWQYVSGTNAAHHAPCRFRYPTSFPHVLFSLTLAPRTERSSMGGACSRIS